MIGLITPPYGMLLFVMQSISRAKLAPYRGATLCPSSVRFLWR